MDIPRTNVTNCMAIHKTTNHISIDVPTYVQSDNLVDNVPHNIDSIEISIWPNFSILLSILSKQHTKSASNVAQNSDLAHDPTSHTSISNLAGNFCIMSKHNYIAWIIDIGATDHICNKLNMFTNLRKLYGLKHTITVPDVLKIKVTQVRDVQLSNNIMLYNVLYVPDFQFSLIYVSKLCLDLNVTIAFSSNECVVQDHSMKATLVLGMLTHGLYYATQNVPN